MRLQVCLIKIAVLIEYKYLYTNLCKEFDLSLHDILIDKTNCYKINVIQIRDMK